MNEVTPTRFQSFAVRTVLAGKKQFAYGAAGRAGRFMENHAGARSAAEVFLRRPYGAGAVRAQLRDFLRTEPQPDREVDDKRANAARVLGELRDSAARDQLTAILGRVGDRHSRIADMQTMEAAVIALGRIGDARDVPLLEDIRLGQGGCQGAHFDLSAAAAKSLIEIKKPGPGTPEMQSLQAFAVVESFIEAHHHVMRENLPASRLNRFVTKLGRFGENSLPALIRASKVYSENILHTNLLALMLLCGGGKAEGYLLTLHALYDGLSDEVSLSAKRRIAGLLAEHSKGTLGLV